MLGRAAFVSYGGGNEWDSPMVCYLGGTFLQELPPPSTKEVRSTSTSCRLDLKSEAGVTTPHCRLKALHRSCLPRPLLLHGGCIGFLVRILEVSPHVFCGRVYKSHRYTHGRLTGALDWGEARTSRVPCHSETAIRSCRIFPTVSPAREGAGALRGHASTNAAWPGRAASLRRSSQSFIMRQHRLLHITV